MYRGQKHRWRVFFEHGGFRDVLAVGESQARRVATWAERLTTLTPDQAAALGLRPRKAVKVRARAVTHLGHAGTGEGPDCPICAGHPIPADLFTGGK